jgi:2-polyprenyl-3-methyl-5-hydroxy-6-metoxy-1,4-benzoquinol methylase
VSVEEYIKTKNLDLRKPRDYMEAYRYAGKISAEYWKKADVNQYLTDAPEQHLRIDWIISMLYGSVLDVGCAEGMMTSFISAQTYIDKQRIVGVDPSLDLITFANHWKLPIHYIQSVGEYLPFKDDLFDCVVAAELIEHVPDPDALVEECRRVLKPMGILIMTTPLDEDKWRVTATLPNVLHLRSYTEKQMEELLSRHGFKTITARSGILGDIFKYPYYTLEGWKEKIVQTRLTFIYVTGLKLAKAM